MMENLDYLDSSGNVYGYEPSQYSYYQDPRMQHFQGQYYNPGQVQYMNWGWQPHHGHTQGPHFYGGYPQQIAPNYDYCGTTSHDSYSQQQTSKSYSGRGGSQDAHSRIPSVRSKHSYSHIRTRNRQKPEVRQGTPYDRHLQEADSLNENNNASGSSGEDVRSLDNICESHDKLAIKTCKSGSEKLYNDFETKSGSLELQNQEKRHSRRGRSNWQDSHTRPFDHNKQAIDRHKSSNMHYKVDGVDGALRDNDTDKKLDGKHKNKSESDERYLEPKDQVPKQRSYKESRQGSYKNINLNVSDGQDAKQLKDGMNNVVSNKQDNRQSKDKITIRDGNLTQDGNNINIDNKEKSQNFKTVAGRISPENRFKQEENIVIKDPSSAFSTENSALKDNENGTRRKKKEIQVYSSNSPRDWQGKSVTYQNQQDAYERYNYRGQDYNKRHKDNPATSLERGGSRTKLSDSKVENNDDKILMENEDDNLPAHGFDMIRGTEGNLLSNVRGPVLHRGTKLTSKPKKVDESQRGVLIEQLSKSTYECMVCCETVLARAAVWSCSNCYHVFHLKCIKKWARSPNSVVTGSEKDGWRCPACQNLSFKFPHQYRCFCGKVLNPEVSRMDTPHSCGDVCQKDRGEGCKHPCNILCHPGPCPECTVMVSKSCDCGKTKQTAKCSQSMVIKCDLICERQLNCGKHFCKAKCHAGSCEKCEITYKKECYGKHTSLDVVCGSEESFTQAFSCQTVCSKKLDCGNHTCNKPCHPEDCGSCPLNPQNIMYCPCGAVPLDQLSTEPRKSCLDPLPTCNGECNKILKCGPKEAPHRCHNRCHEGPCAPCDGTTTLSCRCLLMDKKFKCSEIAENTDGDHMFLCDKRCNRKKHCGRHKCGLPCCVKEEHHCDQICGRKLSCGLHKCEEPCHRNNCPPCLMAGFDELTCHCGAEVLFPPIPCGTKPPECHRPCTRVHSCDHQVRHNCHSDEKCTPCTELTKKMCMGNHVQRLNIPCHLTDISCGMKCSRPLPCGEHLCIKTCHKGACLDDGEVCSQPCHRKRLQCEHICGLLCHGQSPCPHTACKAKMIVKCACGHRETELVCSMGEATDYQKMSLQNLKDSIQGIMNDSSSVNIGKLNQARSGQGRFLECNEECAMIERNRRLAVALDIQNPDLTAKVGNFATCSDFLKEFAKKDPQFVAGVERALGDLVQSAKQSKQPSRSHSFASMNGNQRKLVHELAEFYGCVTQSYDYEPKKNVVAIAVKDKCWLPTVSLTAHVQRELHPRAPPPIPHVHSEESLKMTSLAAKLSTSLVGERDNINLVAGAEGWQIMSKKTKKITSSQPKSAIATIDKFESNLEDICATGTIDYETLSKESKQALKSEPVVDYFDFTVN